MASSTSWRRKTIVSVNFGKLDLDVLASRVAQEFDQVLQLRTRVPFTSPIESA